LKSADSLIDVVHERGPMTVAAFMDLALYDPAFGYYARAARRSGRAGDFFTSVDVGPLFGELLAVQIVEMCALLQTQNPATAIDIVEAGAGGGRLAADVMRAMAARDSETVRSVRLHLVEVSASARAQQSVTLGNVAHLASSTEHLPPSFEGVLFANELLDAFPVHQVVMREDGLKEVYVEVREGRLATAEGPPSTPALASHLAAHDVTLEVGARAEIGLRAIEWVRDAARRLRRGFIILIDYGHEAKELYSPTHAGGTLTTFTGHVAAGPRSDGSQPAWLLNPGEQDITAHVDFTSIRKAGESEGMVTLGLMDQTYFLMGLAGFSPNPTHSENFLNPWSLVNPSNTKAFATLMMPGGLGSTMKVMILGKHVGRPALAGCSFPMRFT
jgi:SAM-dependent MidA family methyltransferase